MWQTFFSTWCIRFSSTSLCRNKRFHIKMFHKNKRFHVKMFHKYKMFHVKMFHKNKMFHIKMFHIKMFHKNKMFHLTNIVMKTWPITASLSYSNVSKCLSKLWIFLIYLEYENLHTEIFFKILLSQTEIRLYNTIFRLICN